MEAIADIEDRRFHRITPPHNMGFSAARNTGLQHARSEFVVFIDSDDYVSTRMLELMVSLADQERLDVVVSGYTYVDGDNHILARRRLGSDIIDMTKQRTDIFSVANVAVWNKLWRRSLFVKYDILFPTDKLYEDLATTPRLLSVSRRIGLLDEYLYYYFRTRQGSFVNSLSPAHLVDYF